MIVLALALPLLMMAALFALVAFEDWLFPPLEPAENLCPAGIPQDHAP